MKYCTKTASIFAAVAVAGGAVLILTAPLTAVALPIIIAGSASGIIGSACGLFANTISSNIHIVSQMKIGSVLLGGGAGAKIELTSDTVSQTIMSDKDVNQPLASGLVKSCVEVKNSDLFCKR